MKWNEDFVTQAAGQQKIVSGFNIFGYEDARAVMNAAERANAPVLLMINRDARQALAVQHWGVLLESLAAEASVPVGIHLDHSDNPNSIVEAINCGFTSVMYDGSKQPFWDNLLTTRQLAELAHAKGVLLEAELGTVPYDDLGETHIALTDAREAARMSVESQADWLAVSVGNVHRLVDRTVDIRFDVLEKIQEQCALPLVIHGSSGIAPADLSRMRQTRVGKMNFGTVLRKTFGEALREQFTVHPHEFDRLKLFEEPIARVEQQAYEVISMLWSGQE